MIAYREKLLCMNNVKKINKQKKNPACFFSFITRIIKVINLCESDKCSDLETISVVSLTYFSP